VRKKNEIRRREKELAKTEDTGLEVKLN